MSVATILSGKARSPDERLMQICAFGCNVPDLDRTLAKGANVNARNGNGMTPLMLASKNWTHQKYLIFLQKLLDSGAEVNVESEYGQTVLDMIESEIMRFEAAREREIKDQEERREIMEGRGPVGWGFGTSDEQRRAVIWNRPLADELDEFKMLPQLHLGRQLLEKRGAKAGEASFNPAYLTAEEFVELRDGIASKYQDSRYTMRFNS
mmetsp:Transcript_68072/g.134288  ORF Transcript_68072/g.134288 Transcript_68072/m.134288 type:complete len:208 (-) Transcript_68072:141-764(-)